MNNNIKLFFDSLSLYRNYSFIAGIITKEGTLDFSRGDIFMENISDLNTVIIYNKSDNTRRNIFTHSNDNINIWSLGKYIDVKNTIKNSVQDLILKENTLANLYENNNKEFFNAIMFEGLNIIYDKREKNITIYSDKMGLEDIYYFFDSDVFAFCNLIGPLSKAFSKKFDSVGIMNYISTGAIIGPATLFDNIKSLLPAHKLEILHNGKLINNPKPGKYWQLPKPIKPSSFSQENLEKYFVEYYLKAIERRIDKEVNVFLSGGLDSSSIVSAAKNNFGSKVNAFNYRIKGYSRQYVESEIIEKFQKDFGFSLNFVEVDNLGEDEYNLWKDFIKFSPNYFGIGTLILHNSVDKYLKNNNSGYPFLTGETADTVIDFWCGVKGNGWFCDNVANLNRFFYSPKAVFLAKQPFNFLTGWMKPVTNFTFNLLYDKGFIGKVYKYIDWLLSIIYSFGRPEIYYTGRLVSGTPGWRSIDIMTPEFFKTKYDDNLNYIAKNYTKVYADDIKRNNMMQVYAMLVLHALSYTDTQIYRRVSNFYNRSIEFPYLDTEFISMTTALPFKQRAFKTLFRQVGKKYLGLPDYIAEKQKIDFFVKEDKPVHQILLEMPIGDNIRKGLKDKALLDYIDDNVINKKLLEKEIDDFIKGKAYSRRIMMYQTLEWNAKNLFSN